MAGVDGATSYAVEVPKPLDLTDDLLALGRAAHDAELALEAAARAEDGDVENARQTYLAAAAAVYAHPLLEQARREGCHAQTWQAVKDATRAKVDG